MENKTGKAQGNLDQLIEPLSRLVLEYQAAHSVLKAYGPVNWAKLLHDYRVLPKNQTKARVFDAIPRSSQAPTETIVAGLVEAIDKIVPLYPSQTKRSK